MLRLALSLMVVMVSAGCSQRDPMTAGVGGAAGSSGGVGGVGGAAGSGGSGGGSTADYFPLVDGASWTYLHTHADQTTRNETVTLGATTYQGQPGFLAVETPNASGAHDETVLVRMGGSVVRIAGESFAGAALVLATTYTNPGFVRFDDAWLTRADGYAEDRMYTRTETDANGLNPVVDARTHHFTVEAHDQSVTVGAGTFNGVLQVRRDRVGRTTDSNKQFWFAPGVGKIKEVDLTTGDVEELATYAIPGGASGP